MTLLIRLLVQTMQISSEMYNFKSKVILFSPSLA